MRIQQVGQYEENRVSTGFDAGVYVCATGIPAPLARYAKISYREIEDADIRRLAAGETIEQALDPEDLAVRWDLA